MNIKTYPRYRAVRGISPDRSSWAIHDHAIVSRTIALRCTLGRAIGMHDTLGYIAGLTVARYRRRFAVFPAERYAGNGLANKESHRQEPKSPLREGWGQCSI